MASVRNGKVRARPGTKMETCERRTKSGETKETRKDVGKAERRMNYSKSFINGKMSEKWKGGRNAEKREN